MAVAREHGAPVVLSRGSGTSLAGQCVNTAVVIDWSKYCTRVESVDVAARTCVVQPGVVLDGLNRRLAPTGLRFGPEPATQVNCTVGGVIGNNSCGATAQQSGKVVDNIARMEVLLYDGTRFWCGETDDEEYAEIERHGDLRATLYRRLRTLRETYADEIRRRYPDIPRRVSGYNLDSLLPEHGFDVAGLLVGSESTLVTVLRAELELVPVVAERTLVVLGFDGIEEAADAVPGIRTATPRSAITPSAVARPVSGPLGPLPPDTSHTAGTVTQMPSHATGAGRSPSSTTPHRTGQRDPGDSAHRHHHGHAAPAQPPG